MKKAVILTIFMVILMAGSTAYAHPPSDITITFDSKTNTVHAFILHDVTNPENHYIKKVDIALNGKEILEHTISRQDNRISQEVIYRIPDAKKGDIVSVEGYCNIMGNLKKEFIVTNK